jgi:hypothetical protein
VVALSLWLSDTPAPSDKMFITPEVVQLVQEKREYDRSGKLNTVDGVSGPGPFGPLLAGLEPVGAPRSITLSTRVMLPVNV